MSNIPPAEPRARSRGTALYAVFWILLGSAAAGYLVALAVRPDIVAEYLPVFRGAAADSDVAVEVQSIRESVGQVQLDVAKLRVDVDEQHERDKEMTEKIAALEGRPPLASAAADSASVMDAAPESPAGATDIAKTPEPAPPAAPAEPASDGPAAKSEPSSGPASEDAPALETGSVGNAARSVPAASPPAVKPAAAKPAGVQIGTAPSVDVLRLNWLALSDRHGEALKNLQARYVTGRYENGDTHKLIAGPVKDAAEAKRVCDLLARDGVPCAIGTFNGNAL